jgi:hypothetical protein
MPMTKADALEYLVEVTEGSTVFPPASSPWETFNQRYPSRYLQYDQFQQSQE